MIDNTDATESNVAPFPTPSTLSDADVMVLLAKNTYQQVSDITGMSRGKIYSIAKRMSARKYEERIAQRIRDRRREQEEYLREIINKVEKSDVLDFLADIPDESVAIHASSPPYNLGKKYVGSAVVDAMRYTYFNGWLAMIISEMARTLKPGGVVFLNVGKTIDWTGHLMPMDWMIAEHLRQSGLTFQSRIIWTQCHGLTPKSRLADRHETILVFSKGSQATFNPNAARRPQKQPGKRSFKGPNKGQLSGHPFGAFPTDVWDDIPSVRANHPEKKWGDHPAQFPVGLAKRGVLLYTMPGDLVCDCFSGTGTVAEAAIEAHRSFIGADLSYESMREKRIANATPDNYTRLTGVTDESVEIWQAEARRVEHFAEKITADQDALQCSDLFGSPIRGRQ